MRMTLLSVLVLVLVTSRTRGDHCPSSCHCHEVLDHLGHHHLTRIRCSGSTVSDLSSLTRDDVSKELTLDAYRNGNSIDIKRQDFTTGMKIRSLVVKGGSKTILHESAFQNLNDFLVTLRVGNGVVFNSTLIFLRGLTNLKRLELENNKQYWTRENGSHVVSLFSNLGLNQLRYVDMSYCFIYTMSTLVFRGVENISSLDISGNRLSEIPSAINILTHLQFLDISVNSVTFLKSGSFKSLVNLRELRLAGNEFGELKYDVFIGLEKSLVNLDLQMTRQTVIPTIALNKLRALKKLNISENPFKLMPADSLKGDYCLERLDMHYTEVAFQPNMFHSQTDCIRVLSLYRPEVDYIPREAIASLTSLEILEFQGANIKVLKNNSLNGVKAKILDLSFLPLAEIEEGAFNGVSVPVMVTLSGTSLTNLNFALGYPEGTFSKLDVEGSLLCNCDLTLPLKHLGCSISGTCARTDNGRVMYLKSAELRDYLKGCSVQLSPLVCSSSKLNYSALNISICIVGLFLIMKI